MFWIAATPRGRFGGGDFGGASTQMHGRGTQALGCFPRNWVTQSVIDFEDSRAIAVLGQLQSVGRGQSVVCHSHQLMWSHVAQRDVILWERCKTIDARRGLNLAAERRKMAA